ncbi:hypothetical protein GCM10022285_12450 [Streptomyces tunisiensis]|uniref:Uncharacterized protein n=1 Tax=Streptomyces tunisiensis TaxID=948699 RepID=A0ABP7XWV1_9ACTN
MRGPRDTEAPDEQAPELPWGTGNQPFGEAREPVGTALTGSVSRGACTTHPTSPGRHDAACPEQNSREGECVARRAGPQVESCPVSAWPPDLPELSAAGPATAGCRADPGDGARAPWQRLPQNQRGAIVVHTARRETTQ